MFEDLPRPLVSKTGFQGCFASFEINGEQIGSKEYSNALKQVSALKINEEYNLNEAGKYSSVGMFNDGQTIIFTFMSW